MQLSLRLQGVILEVELRDLNTKELFIVKHGAILMLFLVIYEGKTVENMD